MPLTDHERAVFNQRVEANTNAMRERMTAHGLDEMDQSITLTGYAASGHMARDAMVDTILLTTLEDRP